MKMLQVAVFGLVVSAGVTGTISSGQSTNGGGTGTSTTGQFPSASQHNQQNQQTLGVPANTGRDLPSDSLSPRMEEQMARNRNNDRQKRLMADTEKLLALATDLKEKVDKTDKNMLSVDVIKKADEIEKLAHSVKERMKG